MVQAEVAAQTARQAQAGQVAAVMDSQVAGAGGHVVAVVYGGAEVQACLLYTSRCV